MEYWFLILTLVSIYAVLASALNLSAGYGGMLSLAQAAFFGIGAYTYALVTMHVANSFLLGLLAGMVVACVVGACCGWFFVRLRGDLFLLATVAFQMLFETTSKNWVSLTGGPDGLPGIPRPSAFGFAVSSTGLLLLEMTTAVAVIAVIILLSRSSVIRDASAVRDDWGAAESLGIYAGRVRLAAFVLSTGAASLAGGMYAAWFSFVSPASFVMAESIGIFVMLVVGGLGTCAGPILGAALLVLVPELIRFSPLPDTVGANVRQILYGVGLTGVVVFWPSGIAGRYALD